MFSRSEVNAAKFCQEMLDSLELNDDSIPTKVSSFLNNNNYVCLLLMLGDIPQLC